MSRPSSRNGRTTPGLNDVVRRSRALTNSIIMSYGGRSSSRDASRGRRGSISNEYKRRSISLDRASRFDDMIAQSGGVPRATKIRRWDGNCRTTTNWDCLRKDPELWFSNGDCLVHFYGEDDPRRGASLRLWLADIQSSNCRPLLRDLVCRPYQELGSDSDVPGLDERKNPLPSYDLYIPAPPGFRHELATNYHLTTRNFFAWMFEKQVVGSQLGEALCSLLDRMNQWRNDSEENEDDFLAYIDAQGYTDFRDCPDHALALLHWAEVHQHLDLWIDSFVHCTGMNDQLISSHEFNSISMTTKAMITRANLDVAVRLDRASALLANFCEDDAILNRRLKLSDATLAHLDRFRAFLQGFYVQRHGYWPPHVMKSKFGKVRPLPKHSLLTMYADFRNLYEFMVNSEADPFLQPEISRSVVDVLTTFDEEMKFTPLPHLIPHLPTVDFEQGELRKSKSVFNLFRSKKVKNNAKRTTVASALTMATNVGDIKVVSAGIVREYALFERDYTLYESESITSSEARMARWVLVYALLQILISVTHAPDEVRDVEGVDYPLCVQMTAGPPWKNPQTSKARSLRRRSQSLHSPRQSVAPGVQSYDFAMPKPTTAPVPRIHNSNNASPGPPPSAPLPIPTIRAPSRAEQAAARERSSAPASRIPVRVPSRASIVTPKPSRIPIAVNRIPSNTTTPAQLEVIDDPTAMAYLSDYDVDKRTKSNPSVPSRSLKRSPQSGSTVATIVVVGEPGTPPPLSAKSIKRQSLAYLEHLEQMGATHSLSLHASSSSSTVPASTSSPSVSPISTKDEYFGPPATTNFSLPISSAIQQREQQQQQQQQPAKSPAQVPLIQAAPRGRATNRPTDRRSRRGSSTSDVSDFSSGTERHTATSRITTPSLYTPSHFGDRFVKSRQSNPSTPKDAIFRQEEIPPLPMTPATPHSAYTMATSIYTLAPEYPVTAAIGNSDEDNQFDDIQSIEQPLRSHSRALSNRPEEDENSSLYQNVKDNPLARFSLHRAVTDHALRSGKSLHETGKSRRFRFLRSNSIDKSPSSEPLSARRQRHALGLTALAAGNVTSKSLVSASVPNTPMAMFHDEAVVNGMAPRPGTSAGTSRPSHSRQHSSELAKQFRKEIGWKRGAGWDKDVNDLLMGQKDTSSMI